MTEKTGWTGSYFEDFEAGMVCRHPYGRTILDADNVWFTNFTMNTNQIHFNSDYASKTTYGRPLVNSCFTFHLVTGLSAADLSRNGIVRRWRNVRMPGPLFVGETVYAESKILDKKEALGGRYGLVTAKTRGVTESGKIVMECISEILVYKRGNFLRKEDAVCGIG